MARDTVKLPVTLRDGTLLTDEVLEDIVAEAETGYDPAHLRPHPLRPRRPSLGQRESRRACSSASRRTSMPTHASAPGPRGSR